jgi:primosomal protein N''
MAEDKPMRSAYELAMERFKKKDAEAGVVWEPLTDGQKAAIAEIRNFYEAKLAELSTLHQASLRKTMDPAEQETLGEDYRRERERLTSQRDAKIEQARKTPD